MENLRFFKGFDGKEILVHKNKELERVIEYLNPQGEQNFKLKATVNPETDTVLYSAGSTWCETYPYQSAI